VVVVEVGGGHLGDEELRAVGVRPRIRHRQVAGFVEGLARLELMKCGMTRWKMVPS
jgi:hypothetical protein